MTDLSDWPKIPDFLKEKTDDDLFAKYREVLVKNPIGRDVLRDILALCHFGEYIEMPYEAAQHNVGIAILARCRIIGPEKEKSVVNALCRVVTEE